jgi:hypothetical protein
VTIRLHSWPTPSQALALVASPRLGLRHPNFLIDSIVSQKVKITEGERVGVHSLTYNTLGVEGHAGAPG